MQYLRTKGTNKVAMVFIGDIRDTRIKVYKCKNKTNVRMQKVKIVKPRPT